MKTREIQELKQKPVVELERLLAESMERLRVLKFDLAAGKVKDIAELRTLRRDIARLETFIKQTNHGTSA